MSKFEGGDDVVAKRDVSTGFFGYVRKGTAGVIVRVHDGFWSTTYDVRFEGERGVTDGVSEDDLG